MGNERKSVTEEIPELTDEELPEFRRLVLTGWRVMQARKRLEADDYEDPEGRTADAIMVGLPSLLAAIPGLSEYAEGVFTILGDHDHVRPELTTIPADAYWPKGDTVAPVGPPPKWCDLKGHVPKYMQRNARTDDSGVCFLNEGHPMPHYADVGESADDIEERASLWLVWEEGRLPRLRRVLKCRHAQCGGTCDGGGLSGTCQPCLLHVGHVGGCEPMRVPPCAG